MISKIRKKVFEELNDVANEEFKPTLIASITLFVLSPPAKNQGFLKLNPLIIFQLKLIF